MKCPRGPEWPCDRRCIEGVVWSSRCEPGGPSGDCPRPCADLTAQGTSAGKSLEDRGGSGAELATTRFTASSGRTFGIGSIFNPSAVTTTADLGTLDSRTTVHISPDLTALVSRSCMTSGVVHVSSGGRSSELQDSLSRCTILLDLAGLLRLCTLVLVDETGVAFRICTGEMAGYTPDSCRVIAREEQQPRQRCNLFTGVATGRADSDPVRSDANARGRSLQCQGHSIS